MSNGVEVIFQDLARDLKELGEAAQEAEALLNRGAEAREATGRQLANAFGLGGDYCPAYEAGLGDQKPDRFAETNINVCSDYWRSHYLEFGLKQKGGMAASRLEARF